MIPAFGNRLSVSSGKDTMPNNYATGFELHHHAQRAPGSDESASRAIRTDDIVRPMSGGQTMLVNEVDGDHIYCDGFLDPFCSSRLEVLR